MDKKKIMVIDDSESFLNLIKNAFEECFEIYSLNNTEIALDEIKKIKPDLILMDLNMPNIDGIKLSNMLLRDSQTSHIPIIILSATDYNIFIENILRSQPNVYSFLPKILSLEVLKENIDDVLKKTNKRG